MTFKNQIIILHRYDKIKTCNKMNKDDIDDHKKIIMIRNKKASN